MGEKLIVRLTIVLAVCGLLFTVACTKPKVKSESTDLCSKTVLEDEQTETTTTPEMTSEEKQMTMAKMEEKAIQEEIDRAREVFLNENVHFQFDKSTLTPEAQAILRVKARWLRNHPNVSVVIEGHCDERGSDEYNLALGDRRAKSAKDFLVDLGVDPSRMTTISYGEEKPLDPRSTVTAWAKNRRAEFVIR